MQAALRVAAQHAENLNRINSAIDMRKSQIKERAQNNGDVYANTPNIGIDA